MIILVVAGDYGQYRRWARKLSSIKEARRSTGELLLTDDTRIRYVSNAEQCRGYSFFVLIRIGTWYETQFDWVWIEERVMSGRALLCEDKLEDV